MRFSGAALRTAREARGLSQGQLATLVGASVSSISRTEAGEYRSLHAETLALVANVLGVPMEAFFERPAPDGIGQPDDRGASLASAAPAVD